MGSIDINVVQTEDAKDLQVPKYMTDGAAGLDLYANVTEEILGILERKKIKTGLCIEVPNGYEGQVRPRSGLADKYGVTVLNSPGTIDSDFRGEIKVMLINLGDEPFVIKRGDRIAQLVIAKVEKANMIVTKELSSTSRGSGEFGHTGRS